MSDDPTLTDPVKRLRYFDKQFLQAGDFTDEQAYHMRLRRLLNRSFFTPGIGFGLELELSGTDLTVMPGLAIDDQGRELVVNEVLKPQAQPAGDADVYLQYQEQESDPATLGLRLSTRWDQTPQILTQTAGAPPPAGAVYLGSLNVDGGRSTDVGSRRIAGLRSSVSIQRQGTLFPGGRQNVPPVSGDTSLRTVATEAFFDLRGSEIGTATLGIGFDKVSQPSSFVGAARHCDCTLASLLPGRMLRIGSAGGRICFWTDGNVALNETPQAYLAGADLYVTGAVFTSDLKVGATPQSLLTGGKLDTSFLPDSVPLLTNGKLSSLSVDSLTVNTALTLGGSGNFEATDMDQYYGQVNSSLRLVAATDFLGPDGIGTALLGLGFEFTGPQESSKHGFVGSGRAGDWTLASLTARRALRIGTNQGRIAFYTDGTVAKDADPQVHLDGADLYVQGGVFSSSLTVTGDLKLGASPKSLLTGGKLDTSFLPDSVPLLTNGKLSTLKVDSLVVGDLRVNHAAGSLYAVNDPLGSFMILGLGITKPSGDSVAFLGLGRNRDLTIASFQTNWLRIGASGPICFWMNGVEGVDDSPPQAYLDTNGNLHLSGSLYQTDKNPPSDRRLKQDIRRISGALERVERLAGVRFRWNDEGLDRLTRFADGLLFESGLSEEELAGKRREAKEKACVELSGDCIGMIAQDVREVVPEVVEEGKDGYLRLAYDRLVALLVEAVKEQQEAIEKLEGELARVRDALALRNA